jgi:hypothetical protein
VAHFGVQTVDAACLQALKMKTVSKEVVLNLLYRGEDKESMSDIDLGAHLHTRTILAREIAVALPLHPS